MFGKRFHVFNLFGFPVNVDVSWFVVAVLLTWTYATILFPDSYPGLSTVVYWTLGAVLALGLFASVLFHETGHAITARRYGVPMKGITLFIFGGVAEMEDEPPHPRAEFVVAIMGPAVSIVLAVLFGAVWLVGRQQGLAAPLLALFGYLSAINGLLVVFNMIPAFPLDGGRVLRSILWDVWNDLGRATRVTSRIGAGFGLVLLLFGGFLFIQGAFIQGVWMVLIGLFLRNAARLSYQQLQLRQVLEGEPVSRFMATDVITVPRSISVAQLVEEYILRHHHKLYPVVDGDQLVGCVTTHQVKQLDRDEWERQSVGAIAQPVSDENSIAPDTDAMEALARMSSGGSSRLLVARDGELVGLLALKDLLEFFRLKVELETKG